MSKIDISAEPLCNDLMPGKLQPVIQGNRQYFCFASAGSATVSASMPSTAALALSATGRQQCRLFAGQTCLQQAGRYDGAIPQSPAVHL